MLYWSFMFLIIAIISGLLGFTSIAGTAFGIAKIIFFITLVLWAVAFLVLSKFIKK